MSRIPNNGQNGSVAWEKEPTESVRGPVSLQNTLSFILNDKLKQKREKRSLFSF